MERGVVDWPEGTAPNASALLDIEVDRDGVVTRVRVLETEEALGEAVAAAVASWRFEPPAAKRARFFFTVLVPASG